MTHPFSSSEISIFSPKISNFCYIKMCRYRLHFNIQFLILLTFFESLKVVLIKLVAILAAKMSAKLALLCVFKIDAFWNKGYVVTTSVRDVINKILLRDSNYIVDVIMWPNFGNSSISMTEVIITLSFFKLNNLGLAVAMAWKLYTSVGKGLKLKVRKFLEANSYVSRSYRGKTGRGLSPSWIELTLLFQLFNKKTTQNYCFKFLTKF